jgi:Flp pilus assembly protein TadG
LEDERGVSLIIVAIMILVLTAMSSLVLDYGVVWLGRRQAQNAADAGALAGAQALAKDDSTWTAGAALNSVTDRSANGVAQVNRVLGATPGTEALAECPTWMTAPANVNCVRVNVYRDGTHGSTAMPVFFAKLLGQTSQNIRATATAQVLAANTSGCERPWFIPDRYTEVNGVPGYQNPPDVLDSYTVSPKPGDIGKAVVFHLNSSPSAYGTIDVGPGANAVGDAIRHCVSNFTFAVGQTVPTEPGNMVGPVDKAIDDLLKWDPGAMWDSTKLEVVGGCSTTGTCSCDGSCPYGGTQSPRIVQSAICDPVDTDCRGDASGKGSIVVTNILSFFITGCNDVIGSCKADKGIININAILIGSAGMFQAGPTPDPSKAFVTVQMLVR